MIFTGVLYVLFSELNITAPKIDFLKEMVIDRDNRSYQIHV